MNENAHWFIITITKMEQYPYIFQPIIGGDDSVKTNDNSYHYENGQIYEEQSNYKKAFGHYKCAHSKNGVRATYRLAEHKLTKKHLSKRDFERTTQYLTTACERGIVNAILNLAILYMNKQESHLAENVIKCYPIHSLNNIILTTDKKHHNIIYYFLGIKFELRKETGMAIKYYLQSYKLNCRHGLQKLTKLIPCKITLNKMLERENTKPRMNKHFNPTEKDAIMRACQNCGINALCFPYGRLFFCKSCLQKCEIKTPDELFYACYMECYAKHNFNSSINCNYVMGALFECVKAVSKTNDYCNEIIYAWQRKNNALYAQILKTDCETYTQQVKTRAITQMLHYVAKVELNTTMFDKAMKIYQIICNNYNVCGKLSHNVGWLYEQQKTFDESLKYYLIAYGTGISLASYNITHVYLQLNDKIRALGFLIKSIHDNNAISLSHLRQLCDSDKIIDTIFVEYFENRQICMLGDIKKYVQNNRRFYNIISRVTNPHRLIKEELNKLSWIGNQKTDDCVVCFEEGTLLSSLQCEHYFCDGCIKKMMGVCPYRCK